MPMSPLIKLLNAMKFVFESGDQFDVKTHVPTVLSIKEFVRIIENKEHISWMDCVVDDQLPRALCILDKNRPKYFQVIFGQNIKLPDRNYPLVDGLEPKIEYEPPRGTCVLYCDLA